MCNRNQRLHKVKKKTAKTNLLLPPPLRASRLRCPNRRYKTHRSLSLSTVHTELKPRVHNRLHNKQVLRPCLHRLLIILQPAKQRRKAKANNPSRKSMVKLPLTPVCRDLSTANNFFFVRAAKYIDLAVAQSVKGLNFPRAP